MRAAGFAAAACLTLALSACAEGPLCKSARKGDAAGLKDAASASEGARREALYCAVDAGNVEAVRALLAAGAPISHFAMSRARDGQPEILSLLRQEEARRDAAKEKERAAKPVEPPREPRADVDVPSYKDALRLADAGLVVGVEGFGPHDADAVRAHLLALGYLPARVASLTGAAATRLSVLKALDALKNARHAAVYVSARAVAGPDGAVYLLTSDADAAYLEDSALPLTRLYSALKGAHAVVVLEAAAGEAALPKPPEGVTVLAAGAGASDEAAASRHHGAFTVRLLKALEAGKRSAAELRAAAAPAVRLGPDAPL